ncbi:4'-phosphopantetheinyl transferase [Kribbella flavida DSM 17836]|uniref:4'-phosphopantetheinyl transferase n=1 Tax=Kribbella flavida (strain DSM 17836 / JCM 10339 / NBRC 14399) TaxID=479435 RepID=D2PT24_KRIFD|nr:4'-phosphopantetheinyl transferase [Kribbella flavida DSM 17836]
MHVWVTPTGDEPRSAAHRLLEQLGSSLLGTPAALRHATTGRPTLNGLSVSLSHARTSGDEQSAAGAGAVGTERRAASGVHGLVAVAASVAGPVGVDLEVRRAFAVTGMARRWFDPAEAALVEAADDPVETFLLLWTAKEAVGKALGRGLRSNGLGRRMPALTTGKGTLHAHAVPSEDQLVVVHVPLRCDAVLALACPRGVREIVLTEHHGAALRSTVRSRTSFPVVVLGN